MVWSGRERSALQLVRNFGGFDADPSTPAYNAECAIITGMTLTPYKTYKA